MWRSHRARFMGSAVVVSAAVLVGAPAPAGAAEIELPAGVACADFGLGIDIEGGPQVNREFFDRDGNLVRWISAGRGSVLTFTNLTTDATFSLKSNGSVTSVVNNPDGTSTWSTMGHNVLILFPTDVPPGPSTTAHVGRVVFTEDPTGSFTFEVTEVTGRSTDICAALSN